MVNVYRVSSNNHRRRIIALGKLAESRQARKTHPHLELFIVHQVRVPCITVSVRVSQLPIGRHRNLGPIRAILALATELFVRLPRNIRRILHHVGNVVCICAFHVQEHRRVEGIVENGIWRKAARVIWPLLFGIRVGDGCQGRAVAAVNVAGGHCCPGQLRGIEGFGIPPVVLVEVRKMVVEEDWGCHVRGDREFKRAAPGWHIS